MRAYKGDTVLLQNTIEYYLLSLIGAAIRCLYFTYVTNKEILGSIQNVENVLTCNIAKVEQNPENLHVRYSRIHMAQCFPFLNKDKAFKYK